MRLLLALLIAYLPFSHARAEGRAGTTSTNTLMISEQAGVTTQNYPLQIARPFLPGEIPAYPQALIDGLPVQTQADVKQRYPDGSVRHAILTFFIPRLAAHHTVQVTFQNQASGLNAARLTAEQMLEASFNFEAGMELTFAASTGLASARQMLQDGNFTYWMEGPVATSIILADHSSARKYDLGADSYRSFRPIYHATFWPALHKVRVRFIGEIASTEALQDQHYALKLSTGASDPQTVYARQPFTHTAASRWTHEDWLGGTPARIAIDHNLSYLKETRFFPNYDTSKIIPESELASRYQTWQSMPNDLYEAGWWLKGMFGTGGRPDIGPYPTWTVQWLYSGDARMAEIAFKQADLAAAWPMHLREGNPAKYLDREHSVPGLGRVLSLAARPTLQAGSWNNWHTQSQDRITPVGNTSTGGWSWDWAHQPDAFSPQYTLSGDFWYLEEMYFWASYTAAAVVPETRGPEPAQYGYGVLHSGLQVRGEAWSLRNRLHTAFLAPDAHPEKAYFNQLLDDAIAFWEGTRQITTTAYANTLMWQFGRQYAETKYSDLGGLSPLHMWDGGITGPQYVWRNTVYKPVYVQLTASADPGSVFSHWEGACADFGAAASDPGCVPEIDASRQITAVFQRTTELVTQTLTVQKNGSGTGSVHTLRRGVVDTALGLITSAGIQCGSDCSQPYPRGMTVILEAQPDSGSLFAGWAGGGCSGSGYCRVPMESTQTVTATFRPLPAGQASMTIKMGGYGQGRVTSLPAGLDCGLNCVALFPSYQTITLTAVPAPGSHFVHWQGIPGGQCTGSTAAVCAMRLDYALWIRPVFRPDQPAIATLSVTRQGTGSGTVASHPFYHIDCGSQCQADFVTAELTEGDTSNWMENFLLLAFGRGEELGYPTGELKKWLGQSKVAMLSDPGFDPYLTATYRTPVIQRQTGRWFSDWSSVRAAFHPQLKGYADEDLTYAQHYAVMNADAEHGYSYIALAAVSYAADLPRGPDAWHFMEYASLQTPELAKNPKWAILPRGNQPAPLLKLHGTPADRRLFLAWDFNTSLPISATWRIDYRPPLSSTYPPITTIPSAARAYTLTNLINYAWYTVTLSSAGYTPPVSATVRLMPTDHLLYLPWTRR